MTNTVQMWSMANSSKFAQKELSGITPALDSVDEASAQRFAKRPFVNWIANWNPQRGN